MGIKVLKSNCDPNDAADKSLPYTAYLVEYKQDGKPVYDIAIGDKAVDLFDYYYDLYKKDFVKLNFGNYILFNPALLHGNVENKTNKNNNGTCRAICFS